MADHEHENAREHLTEREREALKIFAKEFVKEAGLQQIPKQEQQASWVEGEKLEHDTAKTQAYALSYMNGIALELKDPDRLWSAWGSFLLRDSVTLLSVIAFSAASFFLSAYLIYNI